MRRRHLHPYAWRCDPALKCTTEQRRRLDARSQDLVAMVGRLDAVNGTADEIDQRVRPIELARPRAEGSRVPNDEPARSVAGWLMSPQHDDLGSAANQVS